MAEDEKTRVVILSCEKVRDKSCIACAKCFKAVSENAGKFEDQGEVEIVGMTTCGDCPGVIVPKMKLVKEVINNLDNDFDKIFIGTCMAAAVNTSYCPIELEELQEILKSKFGKEVIIGTHPW